MILDRDAEIPMRDGARLRANIYRPDGPGQFPVLMTFGPYGKDVPLREFMQEAWDRLNETYPEILAASSCKHLVFERPKAARESKLRLVGHLLAAKDQDGMLLECGARLVVCGVVRRDLGQAQVAQLRDKARTQRDDFHGAGSLRVRRRFPPNRPGSNTAGRVPVVDGVYDLPG